MKPALIALVLFIFVFSCESAIPTEDFLISKYYIGESNCGTVPLEGILASITPLGCFVDGANSQRRSCNGTHFIVENCAGTGCNSNCIEGTPAVLNECESGATMRTCGAIAEDLFDEDVIFKMVWAKPGCDHDNFGSISIYATDNECYYTNSTGSEFFDFTCNSTTGALTKYYHTSPWCDNAVRSEQPQDDQICLSTTNDQYSSNTLIGCNISDLFASLSPAPSAPAAPTPAGQTPNAAPSAGPSTAPRVQSPQPVGMTSGSVHTGVIYSLGLIVTVIQFLH